MEVFKGMTSRLDSSSPGDVDLIRPEALGRRRLLKWGLLPHPILQQASLSNHDAVIDAKAMEQRVASKIYKLSDLTLGLAERIRKKDG